MQNRVKRVTLVVSMLAAWLPLGSALACPVLNDGANSLGIWDDFQVSTPGTVTISIIAAPSPNSISDYSFSLQSLAGVNEWSTDHFIGSLVGEGDLSVPVSPGLIYMVSLTDLFGANTSGAPSVELTFQPGNPDPVPLPGSLILLLSGLGLTFVRHLRPMVAVV